MTGVTTGPPAYMAPEQVTGGKVGPASDRYSLATIAYEMLTGVIPFDGEALMELLYAQVHREPPAPTSRSPSLGPQGEEVIKRGLAKDPATRWESSSAFVDALAAALRSPATPPPLVAKTMVMAPALASTVPIGSAAVAERVAAPAQPATVAVANPSPLGSGPAPPANRLRRVRRRLVIGIAAVVALLLLLGLCQAALASTTLAVNPNRVAPGGTVTVTATHVPANQVGEIQLWSVVHTYPFTADAKGHASLNMPVPRDIGVGDHGVKICWKNACHAQTGLRVVSGVAAASPTAVANTSPGSTPAAGATPRATPTSAGSTPPATSTPGSTSPPTSKPSPSPTPPPTPAAYITLSASSVKPGGSVTVSGFYFGALRPITISFIDVTTTTFSTVSGSSGSFSKAIQIPAYALPGTATIKACDNIGHCDSKTIQVTTLIS